MLHIFKIKFGGGFFYSRSEAAIEKNPCKNPPAIVCFVSVSTLIQSGSIPRRLAAEKRFLLLKGLGSFKNKLKIAEM